MEWLEAHTRLEQKRKAALRRQQRELQKRRKEEEKREQEQQKLAIRRHEMEQEERLSVATENWHREEEERKVAETRRLEDLKLYAAISKARKRTLALGLSVSTPSVSGRQRLHLLEARIAQKELSLKKSHDAKVRLDALPEKRSKLKKLMHSFFTSSLRKKVERAVYHHRWDRLVPLLEPVTATAGNRALTLLNHESENGFTPALVAIFKRKLGILRKLLEMGASPNTETTCGLTPLLAAVMTGNIVVVDILMEFKVDLNHETKSNVNAVLLAVDKGREEILRALLKNGAQVDAVNKVGRSALIQAAASANTDLFRILLAYGARKDLRDRDGKTALDWAVQLHNTIMESILNSSLTSTNLMAQLEAEDQEGDEEALSLLSVNRIDRRKQMAQMDKAMYEADLGKIRALISSGDFRLSPNYEDANGNSPLLVICSNGTCDDVLFCLEQSCIPTHQNREGINGLMSACKRGDVAMINLLMTCGCDLLTQDFAGHDAYYYLNSYDHPELATAFTKTSRAQDTTVNFVLQLGTPVPIQDLPTSEYSISVAHTDLSLNIECTSGSNSNYDTASTGEAYCRGNDEFYSGGQGTHTAMQKWGIKQEVLKQNRHARQLYESERRRILAARNLGRRNGLIAPLPTNPAGRYKLPTCHNCQTKRARKRCSACDQVLCNRCHARLHELAQRRHHQYEELVPELFVGNLPKDAAQSNQKNSFQNSVNQSESCIAAMRNLLLGDEYVRHNSVSQPTIDPEVEKYQRKKRVAKEKAISQMQIIVPVAAAKHATQSGDEGVYIHPAELDLASLYIAQKKYGKAQELLQQVEELTIDALGILHPTMLKVAIGKARILQETHQLEQCASAMQEAISLFEVNLPPDHKDMVAATSTLLQSLNAMKYYDAAVQTCLHAYKNRVRSLSDTHPNVLEIQEQLNEFIAKREIVDMTNEDCILMARNEQDRKRMEDLTNESERHLAGFRNLLLNDPDGLAKFLIFAHQEFAEDMIKFWIAIEEFKQANFDTKTLRSRAVNTYLTFIESRRVKLVTATQRKKIKKAITTPGKKISLSLYDDVQAEIFELVYTGVYTRFLAQSP